MTMSSLLLYFADQKTWILAQFLYVFYQVPVVQRIDSVPNSIGFHSIYPLHSSIHPVNNWAQFYLEHIWFHCL